MIVTPTSDQQWDVMARFLCQYAKVSPSADLHMMGWVSDDQLSIVIGFNNWLGKTCQAHVANLPGFRFAPRSLMIEAYRYVFGPAGRELLLAMVSTKNTRAWKMDHQLGFRELYRIKGMHEDGGDLVMLGITKNQFRFAELERRMKEAA